MSGLGVDLHPYYQRGAQITSDVSFAWVKMTDGTRVYAMRADGRTWTADEHARRLRAGRVPFGGYVYAQPGDGAAEADVLWDECRRLGGTGVAPSCDIESNIKIHTWSVREATDHGRAFCSRMRRIGVRPAVYMDLTLLRDCRPDRWPEDPVIWAPRYGAKPEQLVNNVQYLGRYDVHQYTSSGSLPGSAGKVDWNQAYGNAHLIGEDDMPYTEQQIVDMVKRGAGEQLFEQRVDGSNLYDGDRQARAFYEWAMAQINAMRAETSAMAATLAKLASSPDVTPEQVRSWLRDAVAESITVSGELHIEPVIGPHEVAPTTEETAP